MTAFVVLKSLYSIKFERGMTISVIQFGGGGLGFEVEAWLGRRRLRLYDAFIMKKLLKMTHIIHLSLSPCMVYYQGQTDFC